MPGVGLFSSLGPWHILSFGTLLGTEVFNSFVAGITAFRVLPRSSFATLQSALFPIYFAMQSVLPVILALTFPAERTAIGMTSSGVQGVFAPEHRLHVLTPLAIIFLTSVGNWAIVGPATTKCMKERKHQETRDGKKSYDPPPHSQQMQAMNSKFAKLHGISSLLNMFGCLATCCGAFHAVLLVSTLIPGYASIDGYVVNS